MKVILTAIFGLTIFGLAGCSGTSTNTVTTNTTTSNSRTDTTSSSAGSNQAMVTDSNVSGSTMNASNSMSNLNAPERFMTEAAKGGMAEVELSRLATTKSQNAEVKKYSNQMIQDHTNANAELKQLAAKKGVTLPTELDKDHKDIKEKLTSVSGAEFDKDYVTAMVADHEKSVSLFKAQADGGTDADAKAFAAKTLPKLQMHLEMIKAIQGKMK